MSYMFYCCYNLKNLNLFDLNNQNNINMDYIFDKCHILNIDSFNIKSINKYSNEIDIIIKVEKSDINNKIYFLDNFDSNNNYDETKHFHDGLKELNDKNTELYINNIKYKYKNINIKNILFLKKKKNIKLK